MGGQRQYNPDGGFSQYLYGTIPGSTVTINGIKGKMIYKITDKSQMHNGLPKYADTSDMYFRKGEDGLASQAKVYVDRKMTLDFDWNHVHKNSDGTVFPKGTVHVQVYKIDDKGNVVRLSEKARYMSPEEIKLYGPIIRHFNPNVKFR